MAVGFAGRFVALFGPSGPQVWWGDLEDAPLLMDTRGNSDREVGGAFRLEFGEDGVEAGPPGDGLLSLPFPPRPKGREFCPGRVTLAVPLGMGLEELSIRGPVEPAWAAERIKWMKKRDR